MLLERTTAPAEPIISTADAKAHLRVEHTADDTLIAGLVSAVAGALEGRQGFLNRSLVTQSWTWKLPFFPIGTELHLPMLPLRSVTSIKYYDQANVQQTLSADAYYVYPGVELGYIKLKDTGAWPSTYERDDAVEVVYETGYGAASALPPSIVAAAKLMLTRLYAKRGDEGASEHVSLTDTEKWLLTPHRIQEFTPAHRRYWDRSRAHNV